jgi:uncharacterized membrane protein YczE
MGPSSAAQPSSAPTAAPMLQLFPDRLPERLLRCIVGLACFGFGISMFITAGLGLPPWDVFHQGVSQLTGLRIGWVIEITGVFILLLWIPFKLRPGLGTILNAIEIGLVVNLVGDHLPDTDRLVPRLLTVVGAVLIIGLGSGLYIGAGLGSGPRDGLMLGIASKGVSIRVARTTIEVIVVIAGLLLGGRIGIGTVAFTFGIGPVVQVLLPRLTMRPRAEPAR